MRTEDLADLVGVTRAFISKIELGTQAPSMRTMMRLARVLDLDINQLKQDADPDAPIVPREVA